MSQEIQAIRFDVEDIGKHVKGSKKRFSWTFGLNGRNHTIILDFSFISGKVKLVIDRKTVLQSQISTGSSFQHPFTLDGYAINILQQGQSFELRINNKVFSHLYNQAKTNTEFRNYEDQVKDIKVNQSTFQNTGKTVKLNIGALDGAKKKNKTNNDEQNWGNQMSMPSYFGNDSSSSTQSQKKQVKKTKSLLDQQDDQKKQVKVETQVTNNQGQVDFFADNQPTKPQQPVQKPQQFNTMQNMFSTMNINNQPNPIQQNTQSNGMDLLNNISQNQSNPNQFSTMQQLFATGVPTNTQNLNSIQNINLSMGKSQQPANSNLVNPIVDFNTMQNLFATGANIGGINSLGQVGQPVQMPPPVVNPPNFQTNSNLYSIGDLFATGNQNPTLAMNQLHQANQPIPSNNISTINQLDNFNTMQNLFATQSGGATSATSTIPQNQANLQNLNIQDFNTLQNLFKTQVIPTPQSLTSNTSATVDPFSALTMPTTGTATKKVQITNTTTVTASTNNVNMFNTYSGTKTSNVTVDASSFGTVQKGQLGSIDFLQNIQQPQQQAQPQVPNFSKKKQPMDQDLI